MLGLVSGTLSGVSAFAGILHLDGRPVRKEKIEWMLDTIPQFGTESRGLYVRGALGFGHLLRRIHREDDYDSQPLVSQDGNFLLVGDLRLDNREELATQLQIGAPRKVPDSVFLLHAYQKWGADCVEHLLGAFSFALWDDHGKRLVCARDHLGERPLFFAELPGVFLFANVLQGILASPTVPKELDEIKLADFMGSTRTQPDSTIFKAIKALPAGTVRVLQNGNTTERRYWFLDPARRVRMRQDEEYVEAFRELFRNAVRSRVRTCYPIGATVSGGLDSSAVAAMATQILGTRGSSLTAFSGVPVTGFSEVPPPGHVYDESPYVGALGEMYPSMRIRYVRAEGAHFLTDLEDYFWLFCFPIRNPGFHPWLVQWNREAREDGIRTLLSGARGNHFVSLGGQGYALELAASGHWWRLLREIAAYSRRTDHSAWRILKGRILFPMLPLGLLRRLPEHRKPPWWSVFPMNPAFAHETRILERRAEAGLDPYSRHQPAWRQQAVKTFCGEINDLACHENGQRLGSGLDMSDPTTDVHLVEFCLGLPGQQFMLNGETRRILRRASRDLLPETIRSRTRLGVQGVDLCTRMTGIRQEVGERLNELQRDDRLRRFLDFDRLDRLWATWTEREKTHSFPRFRQDQAVLARGILIGSFVHWMDGLQGWIKSRAWNPALTGQAQTRSLPQEAKNDRPQKRDTKHPS